jgi:hypothetical protein
MADTVLREDNDGVALLTLNRPDKLNALNVELFQELEAHILDIAEQVDVVGCVVLRGAGRCFSAGHDLGDIATGEKLPRPNFQAKVIEALACLPQPVITAATQGRLNWLSLAILFWQTRTRSLLIHMENGRCNQSGVSANGCLGESVSRKPKR